MTRFHRSSHWRTNALGTTFRVRGHEVVRDGAAASPEMPAFQATPIETDGARGLIFRNARCPVCAEAVYFLKASNGGRVFLDSLWPDWDRHPCTVSDDARIVGIHDRGPGEAQGRAGAAAPADDHPELTIHPRVDGVVVGLHREDAEPDFFRCDLDLSRRYFGNAWCSDGGTSLTLLGSDAAPVTIPAVPCAPPGELSPSERIALTRGMRDRLVACVRRLSGMSGATLAAHPSCGTFVVGKVGRTRVVVLPMPMDHGGPVETEAGLLALRDHMAAAAKAVIERLDGGRPPGPDPAEEDQVVYAFDDPLGSLAELNHAVFLAEEGQLFPHDRFAIENHGLDGMGLRHFLWVDMAGTSPVRIDRVEATTWFSLAREAAFCERHWPSEVSGRWRQIETLIARLGAADAFGALHGALIEAGWSPDHEPHPVTAIRYVPLSGSERAVHVLAHLTRDGALRCVVDPVDERPIAGSVMAVRRDDVRGFVRRHALRRG